mgnify:CR=1 FL=1
MFIIKDMNKWRFLLGYGSETDQSKSIAQGLVDIALEKYQIIADIYELDDVDKQVRKIVLFRFFESIVCFD